MAYSESDFQGEFGKWIRREENWGVFGTANFELKICKGKSINPHSAFQEHQLPELWHSKHKFVYHKHSDQSFDKKPFDCSLWVGTPAYVVILFYIPRKQKRFHVIDIDDFIMLMKSSEKPYLTEQQISTVSKQYILCT
jgi:hypothetical protein